MIANSACDDCKAHGAFRVRIEHVEATCKEQWEEINGMKKFMMATLASSVISLLGIVLLLIIQLARG